MFAYTSYAVIELGGEFSKVLASRRILTMLCKFPVLQIRLHVAEEVQQDGIAVIWAVRISAKVLLDLVPCL